MERKDNSMLNKKRSQGTKKAKVEEMKNPSFIEDSQPNRLRVVKQLEYYFSNENLIHDEFMRNLIQADDEQSVKISELSRFAKIKELLGHISAEQKIIESYISYSIPNFSSKLSLSSNGTKVKRIEEFDFSNLAEIKANIDIRTLYVETLPNLCDHNMLSKIFKKYGTVTSTSIPRFKHSKQSKGFGFVTLETIQDTETALRLNGVVPHEFFQNKIKDVTALKVIKKSEWLELKKDYHMLKAAISNRSELERDSNKEYEKQVCIIVKGVDCETKLQTLKIKFNHISPPAFIDVNCTKLNCTCILRFYTNQQALFFYERATQELQDYKFEFLSPEDEELYFKKIQDIRISKKKGAAETIIN